MNALRTFVKWVFFTRMCDFAPQRLSHALAVWVDSPTFKVRGKPAHTHDCGDCTFLGRTRYDNGPGVRTYDLYVCADSRWGAELVARYGDNGDAYLSTNAYADDALDSMPCSYPLVIAHERALGAQLI